MKKIVPQTNPDRIVPPEEGPERFRKMRKAVNRAYAKARFDHIVSTASSEKN